MDNVKLLDILNLAELFIAYDGIYDPTGSNYVEITLATQELISYCKSNTP